MPEDVIKVNLEVTLPQTLFLKFLQTFRDFDIANNDRCHFDITASSETMKTEEVLKVLHSINPPFKYESVFPRNES